MVGLLTDNVEDNKNEKVNHLHFRRPDRSARYFSHGSETAAPTFSSDTFCGADFSRSKMPSVKPYRPTDTV